MQNNQYIPIGGRQEVNPEEVMMLQADINYTIVYFLDGKKSIVATPLKRLEPRFKPFDFFRANKSFIVNLKCVDNYSEATKSIKIADYQRIIVSRRRHMEFKNVFNTIL
jgi:DNA-binding LytR/AlgR family response regulator